MLKCYRAGGGKTPAHPTLLVPEHGGSGSWEGMGVSRGSSRWHEQPCHLPHARASLSWHRPQLACSALALVIDVAANSIIKTKVLREISNKTQTVVQPCLGPQHRGVPLESPAPKRATGYWQRVLIASKAGRMRGPAAWGQQEHRSQPPAGAFWGRDCLCSCSGGPDLGCRPHP